MTPRSSSVSMATPRTSVLDLDRLEEEGVTSFGGGGGSMEGAGGFSFSPGGRNNTVLPPTPARPQVRHNLERVGSLRDTKLLVSTHLARCSSGQMTSPVDFQFEYHFHFIKQIGRSATAEIWLVKSKHSETLYCVKKILAKFKNQAERTRCQHEVEAMTFLPAHANVVKYFRAWQENMQFYCQMELCECGSFGGCLRRLPADSLVDERDIWVMAAQVASGLAHIHDYCILHLDIKPDNIFLDKNGTYKIGDFGVAWVAGQGWELQDGDGGYIAPEVLAMSAQELPTPAADVFSFGATLYEAAAGQPLPRELRQGLTPGGVAGINNGEGGGAGAGAGGVTTVSGGGVVIGGGGVGEPVLVALPEGRSYDLAVLISACLQRNPAHRPSALEIQQRAQNIMQQADGSSIWNTM